MAGVGPKDISLAELHDAFVIFELLNSEEVGFFERGTSFLGVRNGETEIGGRIPINTSGGLKAKGHPVGATGVSQIVELVRQLRGEAELQIVPGATHLFEEPGTLEAVQRLAADWFTRHLTRGQAGTG